MEADGETFTVEYVDIYGEIITPLVISSLTITIDYSSSKGFLHLSTSEVWNATLLHQGCLSSTPDVVTSVVSLRTLELYRRLRLRHAPLSVQAWIKVICDLHNVSLHVFGTRDWY
jgi:hypothetical protein